MTLGATGKVGAALAAATVTIAIVAPAAASGAQTVGQAAPPAPTGACDTDATYVQDSVYSGLGFQSGASGVITSWTTYAGTTATQMKLDVLRPDPASGAEHFIVEQKDVLRDIPATNARVTFTGLHLPIAAGDFIGVYVPPAGAFCLSYTDPSCPDAGGGACAQEIYHHLIGDPAIGSNAFLNNVQSTGVMNASAIVEPDADGDGFGDESQDGCPGNAAAQGACPVGTGIPTATKTKKKKCKKKHTREARAAKKKCRKHKR